MIDRVCARCAYNWEAIASLRKVVSASWLPVHKGFLLNSMSTTASGSSFIGQHTEVCPLSRGEFHSSWRPFHVLMVLRRTFGKHRSQTTFW